MRQNFVGPVSRRRFLRLMPLAGAISVLAPPLMRAAPKRPCRLLLRSSWQTVNIGDIGHTPGVIQLLAEHLPEVEITLWPSNIGNGVEEMLRHNFPRLRFAQSPEELKKAFGECDFLLHGSGPSLVGQKQLSQWRQQTGKPYGIFGITFSSHDAETHEVINGARFCYFRDSVSLQFARNQGLTCPVMEFGPDGAFGCKLRNEQAASAFLRAHDLKAGRFLCVIPRLRYTPYWKIHGKPMTAEDQRKQARSEARKEHDHAPLREAIVAIARQTECRVLVCPEDQSQMAVGKEMLVDPLPEDVKQRVVWREHYWLTDEALSTYVRSAGLFGLEMHSPIMCVGNGIPAIVCRFQEQTSKGFMWRDIGLGDWLFDMDQEKDVRQITPAVLTLARDPAATLAKTAKARAFVHRRQREMILTLRQHLNLP
ncbi:MAG TPA: polysaccharide pyruvyl transferase family protein [Candidatus Sulfotelmatobacter sp.]|nr:polysaccharide pyruvyl transferase family protein [Candidatus Sulfotelmatobacter sp.]